MTPPPGWTTRRPGAPAASILEGTVGLWSSPASEKSPLGIEIADFQRTFIRGKFARVPGAAVEGGPADVPGAAVGGGPADAPGTAVGGGSADVPLTAVGGGSADMPGAVVREKRVDKPGIFARGKFASSIEMSKSVHCSAPD